MVIAAIKTAWESNQTMTQIRRMLVDAWNLLLSEDTIDRVVRAVSTYRPGVGRPGQPHWWRGSTPRRQCAACLAAKHFRCKFHAAERMRAWRAANRTRTRAIGRKAQSRYYLKQQGVSLTPNPQRYRCECGGVIAPGVAHRCRYTQQGAA
jgi:hypothetical protein